MAALQNCKFSTRPKQGKIGKNRRRWAVVSVTIAAVAPLRVGLGRACSNPAGWVDEDGGRLSTSRFEEIRAGFEPAFWVANFTEIFERVAYYGTTAVLAIYLKERLHFSTELTGWLVGTFGLVVWFLPILGGTLADRFGFRRALMFAYLVMTVGYFLLGSLSAPWMESLRQSLGEKWLVLAILMIPALGPGVVKPCVAGTTARASRENVRSLGYSIYYTLVNIGGALGPIMAWLVRKQLGWGVANVFRVAAFSVFLMFWRSEDCQCVDRAIEHVRGSGQFPIRTVSSHLRRLLYCFLAAIHLGSAFHSWICESACRRGPAALRGPDHRYLLPNSGRLLDEKDSVRSDHGARILDNGPVLDTAGDSSKRADACGDAGWSGDRRNHASVAVLRICFSAGSARTAGTLHGLRVLADCHWIFYRRAPRWLPGTSLRRSAAQAAVDVVGDCRHRCGNCGTHVAVRPDCETRKN